LKNQGTELLKKIEESWFFRNDGETAYEPYTFIRLKEKIANELGIPNALLILNTNYHLDNNSKILYPYGYTLKKE